MILINSLIIIALLFFAGLAFNIHNVRQYEHKKSNRKEDKRT